jgi:UDP:flavonoid glycosyltransferase YjiC (YdhE family)
VVLPLFSLDQWANAAAVQRVGAGVALDGDRATRRVLAPPGPEVLDGLAPAVARVLGDRSHGQAAQRIAAEMSALPAADAAVEVLLAAAGGPTPTRSAPVAG